MLTRLMPNVKPCYAHNINMRIKLLLNKWRKVQLADFKVSLYYSRQGIATEVI